jgi:hypothetical protein
MEQHYCSETDTTGPVACSGDCVDRQRCSAKDCRALFCEDCSQKCVSCNFFACLAHSRRIDADDRRMICDVCYAAAVKIQ